MTHPEHRSRITRRTVLQGLAAAISTFAIPLSNAGLVASSSSAAKNAQRALADLERSSGGRLGVHALQTQSGRSIGWRDDERFALCSTFKLPLAAAILREADAGRLDLKTVLQYGKDDMVAHAPVTQLHVEAGGMTIAALAQAAQTTSDNVAANLLLRQLGGTAAFTAILRDAFADPVTRIDRMEPQLNRVPAGEQRDTTSPRAMAGTVGRIMTGSVLSSASRQTLRGWMTATTTGLRRIRAGLPADWPAGDKTGTAYSPGMANKHNDIAVIWPPGRSAVVVAAYFEADGYYSTMRAQDDAVLAQVGAIVADWVQAEG